MLFDTYNMEKNFAFRIFLGWILSRKQKFYMISVSSIFIPEITKKN